MSPWPESLYTFEQMWPRLAEHAHLIAIDLPGFGHSERRDDLLTSSAMGEFVAHLIEAFGLKQPHAVGPDIGTSTLLFTAANHPGILRSIVIGNGTTSRRLTSPRTIEAVQCRVLRQTTRASLLPQR